MISGQNIRTRRDSRRTVYTARQPAARRHPWSIDLRWETDPADPKGQRMGWFAYVSPGFVNGYDVVIGTVRDRQPVQVELSDETPAGLGPLPWRNPLLTSGIDQAAAELGQIRYLPGEPYPAFFQTLGVLPSAAGGKIATPSPGDPLTDPEAATRTRQLRACDIALIAPRLATTQRLEIGNALATGQTFTISTTFEDGYYQRNRAHPYRLDAIPKWEAPTEPDSLQRLLTGVGVQPETDEIRIATVWMVSPPGAGADAEPGPGWVGYPEYHLDRNLSLASKNQPPGTLVHEPISLIVPLAYGVGQAAINAALAPANDLTELVTGYLNGADYSGRFWTV